MQKKSRRQQEENDQGGRIRKRDRSKNNKKRMEDDSSIRYLTTRAFNRGFLFYFVEFFLCYFAKLGAGVVFGQISVNGFGFGRLI